MSESARERALRFAERWALGSTQRDIGARTMKEWLTEEILAAEKAAREPLEKQIRRLEETAHRELNLSIEMDHDRSVRHEQEVEAARAEGRREGMEAAMDAVSLDRSARAAIRALIEKEEGDG